MEALNFDEHPGLKCSAARSLPVFGSLLRRDDIRRSTQLQLRGINRKQGRNKSLLQASDHLSVRDSRAKLAVCSCLQFVEVMDTIQPWDRLGPSPPSVDGLLSSSYPVARVSGDSAFEPDDQAHFSGDINEQGYGLENERNSRPGSLGKSSDNFFPAGRSPLRDMKSRSTRTLHFPLFTTLHFGLKCH